LGRRRRSDRRPPAQQKKGTYCFLGNGDTPIVHHPQFILDQGILPMGAA
jgi:hippurate hydrolase